MKILVAILITSCGVVAAAGAEGTANFDQAAAGATPPAWTAALTGKGTSIWTVEADASAPSKPNVLKQSGEGTFPICIKNDSVLKDGFVEVKFKPVSGKKDQAGGVIWRCRDENNYYIARANALEDNLTIYHTKDGKRVAFKNVDTPVKGGEWHTLRVDFEANHFAVTLDGKRLLEATDDTFSEAGKIGLWTKADSVTLFDDFRFGEK
jgi:hypothetical protein